MLSRAHARRVFIFPCGVVKNHSFISLPIVRWQRPPSSPVPQVRRAGIGNVSSNIAKVVSDNSRWQRTALRTGRPARERIFRRKLRTHRFPATLSSRQLRDPFQQSRKCISPTWAVQRERAQIACQRAEDIKHSLAPSSSTTPSSHVNSKSASEQTASRHRAAIRIAVLKPWRHRLA